MCPADDSHLTLEFKDHFVIRPTIIFTEADNSYSPNKLGEKGTPAPEGFEYNSGKNDQFLGVAEIVEFNRMAGIA
jgi:UDP-N-acetylglucosamine 4,6-dehydratase